MNAVSVQYTVVGVTVHWRISWVHQVDIMSTLGDTLHPDITAVLPFLLQVEEFYIRFVLSVFSVTLHIFWRLGKF